MSVDLHHTARPGASTESTSRLTRVTLGSLAAGAAAALLLSVVVFPGATEAVITGSLLVGFAIGWAMLALVSSRRTTQPQSWAKVPAIAMAATGIALQAISPADAALTALNWIWPLPLLALVVWIAVQVRRSMPGFGRWLLAPVLLVLAFASVGATVENVSSLGDSSPRPAPGDTYTVGDHRLHIDCRGHGTPTVVLFNGLGEISASWARITEKVADTTRVCAYDRAGEGWSDDVSEPQDGVAAAEDLHALLAAAGEQGPFVLAGHSIGGPYAMSYAELYPDDVAGAVMLDSSSPFQLTAVPSYPMQYALMRRGLALMPTLARIGLGPVISAGSHLPTDQADVVDAMNATPRAMRVARDELSVIPVVFEQAQSLTSLGDRPLVVLTSSEQAGTEGWTPAQDRIAALSTDSQHRVVESTHAGMVDDPHGSAESARAISSVVMAVRTGTPLTAS